MKKMLILALLLTAITAAMYAARAQGSSGALVVATCGTLPIAYPLGATRQLTVNTNGQVCQ